MITEALDAFAAELSADTGWDVTRDPGLIDPPCLYLDVPTVTGRTLGGITIAVPIRVLVPGPGDQVAADALCDAIPSVLEAAGAAEAEPAVFNRGDINLPSMTVTATLTIRRS